MIRSWLKDLLDRALAEPERKPTAVAQFIRNIRCLGCEQSERGEK